jgi:membrane protease YdiL (CAAX protease family)
MQTVLELFVYALLLGGVMICIWAVGRVWHRQSVLRYEPRRQVPWEGIDLLLILCAFVLLQWQCITIGLKLAGVESIEGWADLDAHAKSVVILADLVSRFLIFATGVAILVLRAGATTEDLGFDFRKAGYDFRCGVVAFIASLPLVYGVQAIVTHLIPYEHQLIDVVHEQNTVLTWTTAVVSAVIAAPLAEEFLFRILLQGWLEKLELALVLRLPTSVLRQTELSSGGELVDVNSAEEQTPLAQPQHGLLGLPLGTVPILISSVLFALTHFREGTESVALRLLAVTPLLIFGIFLGFVYQRTHRLLPSLTIHCLLNALTMVSLFVGGKP